MFTVKVIMVIETTHHQSVQPHAYYLPFSISLH